VKLPFPEAVLGQHIFAAGKTGAGKSYMLRILIEWLLSQKRRVCILDPKGDHFGIISSADGRGPGFPVVLFGDHKVKLRDSIPINPRAGKEVAELVATGNRPCVIGFRGWMPSDRTRFYIDFASTLFNKNHAPLWLVEDEIHNFAPQGKVMDPDAGKCLHWANRLSSEGRGNGITLLMASQRPQKVHKDTVTCAETLFAMRVVHNLDRAALKEWMDGAGDPERSRVVLNSLAEMQRGEAFVWSPEIKFFERIQFSKITTFDSFGAPSATGKQQDLKGWAEVNLDEVKAKLASTIEEAKASDPTELRKQIAELKRQLVAKPRLGSDTVDAVKAVGVVSRRAQAAAEKHDKEVRAQITSHIQDMQKAVGAIGNHLLTGLAKYSIAPEVHAKQNPDRALPPVDVRVHIIQPGQQELSRKLNGCERKIAGFLDANRHRSWKPSQVAAMTGYSVNGGGFNNALSFLNSSGVLVRENGVVRAGDVVPSGLESQEYTQRNIEKVLDRCELEILKAMRKMDGGWHEVETVAGHTTSADGGPYSPDGGGFNNALSRLRTLEVIDRSSGRVKLTDSFLELSE